MAGKAALQSAPSHAQTLHSKRPARAATLAPISPADVSSILGLQRTLGNQGVQRLLAGGVVQRLLATGVIQRGGGNDPAARAAGDRTLPIQASIAANASGLSSSHFGHHASVFLATGAAPNMQYYKIDLTNLSHGRAGALAIVIQAANQWPDENSSTTWQITPAAAQAAHTRALDFQAHQDQYTYNTWGLGPRRYNCALFVEKILKAAGIDQSAGLIISTPLEVAKGKKF